MKYEEKIKGIGILSFGIIYYLTVIYFLILDFALAKLVWFLTPNLFVSFGYSILKNEFEKDKLQKENIALFEVIQTNLNKLKVENFHKLSALAENSYIFTELVLGQRTDFVVSVQKADENNLNVFINKKSLDENEKDYAEENVLYLWKFLSFKKIKKVVFLTICIL